MPVIQDYLDSRDTASATFLNLDLDFSGESPRAITQFCEWLQNHASLNRINFRSNKCSIGSGAQGTDLSKISPNTLTQLFSAISDNPNVQYIELPRCCLVDILDTKALDAIAQCLAKKETVMIIGNRDDSWLSAPHHPDTLLVRAANGYAKNLVLQNIISKHYQFGRITAFLDELIANKEKAFLSISLSQNMLSIGHYDQLLSILSLNVEVLDLSNNMIGQGATVDDWWAILSTINSNTTLRELSLKNCQLWGLMSRESDEELSEESGDELSVSSDIAQFHNMILEFVKTTHLSKLNISMNQWDQAFLEDLVQAATLNPHLELICGHPDEHGIRMHSTEKPSVAKFSALRDRRPSGDTDHASNIDSTSTLSSGKNTPN